MLEPLRLSLSTFQPDKCYAPYLNTPRSLEACRLNGINPVELVVLPYSEFVKDFPNDADATQRRYERIEAARVRIYQQVVKDWKHLVETKWQPARDQQRPRSARETIVQVPPAAHSTLLELQASRFRKMEQDHWLSLQRTLKLELMKADQAARDEELLAEEASEFNDYLQKKQERRRALEEQQRQHLLDLKEREEQQYALLNQEKAAFTRAMQLEHGRQQAEAKRWKTARQEQQEALAQRMEYTEQLKESIFSRIDQSTRQRQQAVQSKLDYNTQRLTELDKNRQTDRDQRRLSLATRLAATQTNRRQREEEQRQETLIKIAAAEEHRRQIEQTMAAKQQQTAKQDEEEALFRRQERQRKAQQQVEEKAQRTLQQLQYREDLARQELQRVADMQARRKRLKLIRQEAYALAALRKAKAEDYKRQQRALLIEDKEAKHAAITTGFKTLHEMQHHLAETMHSTTYTLKEEMQRLQHEGAYQPEKVLGRLLAVGQEVLLPKLSRKFGLAAEEEEEGNGPIQQLQETAGAAGPLLSPSSSSSWQRREAAHAEKNRLSASLPLYQGDRSAAIAMTMIGGGGSHGTGGPLPIKLMTESRLKQTLLDSLRKVEQLHELKASGFEDHGAVKRSPNSSRANSPGYGHGHGYRSSVQATAGSSQAGGTLSFPNPIGAPTPIMQLQLVSDDEEVDREGEEEKEQEEVVGGTGTGGRAGGGLGGGGDLMEGSLLTSNRSQSGGGGGAPRQQQLRRRKKGRSNKGKDKGHDSSPSPSPSPFPLPNRGGGGWKKDKEDLPLYPFTAGQESLLLSDSQRAMVQGMQEASLLAKQRTGTGTAARKQLLNKAAAQHKPLRPDVNDKAVFLPVPRGSFRREFSKDHPLAKGGRGLYKAELRQGLKPIQMDVPADSLTKSQLDLRQTLQRAEQIEKITYELLGDGGEGGGKGGGGEPEAEERLQLVQQTSNETLLQVLDEERLAEEDRIATLARYEDRDGGGGVGIGEQEVGMNEERRQLEQIFAEERVRANDRIIAATKDRDVAVKKALLQTMNLGKAYA